VCDDRDRVAQQNSGKYIGTRTRVWARAAIASVWLYQGLWCKLLSRCPSHASIVSALPPPFGNAAALVLLRVFYPAPLVRAVPRGFAAILRHRLTRGFSTHPNRTNAYAWFLLLGESPRVSLPAAAGTVNVVEADAAAYLESCPRGSFDAFTLSNILDAADVGYARRLHAAVEHAARPRAVIVMRSFAEPDSREEDEWARQDRALLWGAVKVTTT